MAIFKVSNKYYLHVVKTTDCPTKTSRAPKSVFKMIFWYQCVVWTFQMGDHLKKTHPEMFGVRYRWTFLGCLLFKVDFLGGKSHIPD